MTLRVKPGLEFRRLGDEGILFDPETCKFYRLSAEIVSRLETGTGADLLASELLLDRQDSAPRAFEAFTVSASFVSTCPTPPPSCTGNNKLWDTKTCSCINIKK